MDNKENTRKALEAQKNRIEMIRYLWPTENPDYGWMKKKDILTFMQKPDAYDVMVRVHDSEAYKKNEKANKDQINKDYDVIASIVGDFGNVADKKTESLKTHPTRTDKELDEDKAMISTKLDALSKWFGTANNVQYYEVTKMDNKYFNPVVSTKNEYTNDDVEEKNNEKLIGMVKKYADLNNSAQAEIYALAKK